MGIRGLTAYVAARQDACATEVDDLKNVTLGVDLDSFLHFACRELANSYNAQWLLLGGDARALYVWVREWMQPLFKRKIRLKFVRDPPGMLNIIKDVTHGKRRAEKADKTKALMRGLFATTTPSSPQGVDDNITVPAPPSTTTDPSDLVQLTADAATNLMDTQAVFAFARKALVRCLKHAGCTIVTAPTEADETLGEMVRSKAIYAVVARDSDYLFMYKMRYITLSSIVVDPSSETVRATVFDTDQLAAASGLAPEKLVEWAIVCGNDFTPYVDLHFHLAEALHLPSLRQTQGNYNIGDALVWLQTHLGPSNNWLDDPEFHQLLADDTDLLAHVYGIYSFYGAGDQVKSRFPHASRHSVLSAAEWKYVRKMLDKLMLPSFTIDVLYDQRRSINKRSVLLGLSACPMLAAARAGTYGLLGQTHVEEYETCILTGDRLTRTVQVNPCDMVLKTMNQHAKSKRVHKAKAMVLTWVESSPAVHAAMAAWHPPKKQPDLKYVGYALGMVLASTPVNRLSSPSWMALLLTSVVSICLQKDKRGGFPFASSVGFTRELVELTARFLSSLEALSHVFDILTLHTDVNMHAFYSASLVVYFLSNGPISKSNVRDILLDPALGLSAENVMSCLWSFHTLMAVFAKALPPSSAPSTSSSLLMPSQVIAKHVDKMAVKGTKAAPTKQKHKPVQAASAQTPSTDDKSPLVLEPLAWDEDVDKSSVESKQPPPPRVTDLRQLIFTLPVYKHKAEILHHVATNPLVVIQGETGCGKSTSVPQFLLDEAIDTANIYVTQPRRVAAITLAATVAKMRGETVGKTIGYRVGQVQKDSDATQITYVTTGYMLERLIHSPDSVDRVSHLILDEAHERSMDMDMLLLMLATNWHLWPQLKLVIMSATMDSSIFFQYFKPVLPVAMAHSDELFVGSALHPVKTLFLEDMKRIPGLKVTKLADSLNQWDKAIMHDVELMTKKLQNVVTAQLDLCVQVAHTIVQSQGGRGCILIFVSGLSDIQYLHERFETWKVIELFVLHSDIEIDDQAKAFENVEGKLKIILSTNIAESSVTIPDVTHIINTALEKQIVIHSQTKTEVLVRSWCSKASVKQRSGRAGRIRPGVAFHLFTKQFMDTCMDEYTTPELLRKPLDKVVLQMKAQMQHIGLPSALLANALTPPDLSNIDMAYKVLHAYSAVASPSEKDDITAFGLFSVHFPLDIRLCRLLMYGLSAFDWGVGVVDVVILVAVLASPDLHLSPSRFHIASAAKYVEEMKAVLAAKFELQEGQVHSEPLAHWKLIVECLACPHKGHVTALLKKYAISFRRFQTMLVLVGELCARLIRLAKKPSYQNLRALQPSMLRHLVLLQKFSARMYSPDPWTYQHAPLPLLRLLIVLNYPDCLARGRLPDTKPTKGGGNSKESKKKSQTNQPPTQLALQVDRVCKWGLQIPPADFKQLVAPLMLTPETMHVAKRLDGFDLSVSSSSDPLPFSLSLLFFLRERKFPVDLPVLPLWIPGPGDPDALRVRFKELKVGGPIRWLQSPSGKSLNVSGRSIFGLPHTKLDKKMVVGVFAEQLLTGDGSTLMGGCCTLLPPQVDTYYPIVMLMTTKRDVWLYMDGRREFWTQAKVDGDNFAVDNGSVALQPTMNIINTVRQELSRGLAQTLLKHGDSNEAAISTSDMDALFAVHTKKLKGKMDWVRLTLDTTDNVPYPPFHLE